MGQQRAEELEYIYVLHGNDNRPFYCGHSIDPVKRLRQHLSEARRGGSTHKCGHIRALLNEGQTISAKVVDQCPVDQLADLEAWWIDQLSYRFHLTNSVSGLSRNTDWKDRELRALIQTGKGRKKRDTCEHVPRPRDRSTPEQCERRAKLVLSLWKQDRPPTREEYDGIVDQLEAQAVW